MPGSRPRNTDRRPDRVARTSALAGRATESVCRLPVRIEGCAHAFAIQTVSSGRYSIFLPVLPSELRRHDRVLLNVSDGSIDGRNVTGELAVIGQQISILETPSERIEIAMKDILRTARFLTEAVLAGGKN